jgi:hypothetical protein
MTRSDLKQLCDVGAVGAHSSGGFAQREPIKIHSRNDAERSGGFVPRHPIKNARMRPHVPAHVWVGRAKHRLEISSSFQAPHNSGHKSIALHQTQLNSHSTPLNSTPSPILKPPQSASSPVISYHEHIRPSIHSGFSYVQQQGSNAR